MRTYIFACIHNAGRSQMSAAFFNQLANPMRAQGISAGTNPGDRVHPVVVEVMNEAGVTVPPGVSGRLALVPLDQLNSLPRA